jgi:hypothetical protein
VAAGALLDKLTVGCCLDAGLVTGRWDADRQCARLNLGEEGGAFADDVAVELVVVDAIDADLDAVGGPSIGRPDRPSWVGG